MSKAKSMIKSVVEGNDPAKVLEYIVGLEEIVEAKVNHKLLTSLKNSLMMMDERKVDLYLADEMKVDSKFEKRLKDAVEFIRGVIREAESV